MAEAETGVDRDAEAWRERIGERGLWEAGGSEQTASRSLGAEKGNIRGRWMARVAEGKVVAWEWC
jgi:hypothetical protein